VLSNVYSQQRIVLIIFIGVGKRPNHEGSIIITEDNFD
jgi:hypothetical protein